jgi:hypothetical protein
MAKQKNKVRWERTPEDEEEEQEIDGDQEEECEIDPVREIANAREEGMVDCMSN